jgi:hypothetical protein
MAKYSLLVIKAPSGKLHKYYGEGYGCNNVWVPSKPVLETIILDDEIEVPTRYNLCKLCFGKNNG